MHCVTVKAGSDCAFMTKSGCGYNGGSCHQVIDQCGGCQKVMDLPAGKYCASFPNPFMKWRSNNCNFATHVKVETQSQQQAKINPLKASKRSTKGK